MPKLLVLPKISVIIAENFGFIRFTVDGRYLLAGTRHLESGKFRSAPKISVLKISFMLYSELALRYPPKKYGFFGNGQNFSYVSTQA